MDKSGPKFITVIRDSADETKLQHKYDSLEKASAGKRGQPPMINRLAHIVVFVEDLLRKGIPFATARESLMNKAVLQWHNEKTSKVRKAREKAEQAEAAAAKARGTKDEEQAAKRASEARRAADEAEKVADPRKSRRKEITPDAVEEILRKVKSLL